jgi:hypothetical protein
MASELRTLMRQGARYWWIPLITGVAWLMVSWLVLRLNQNSITTVILNGILLILLAFWVSESDRVYALRQRALPDPVLGWVHSPDQGVLKSCWPSEFDGRPEPGRFGNYLTAFVKRHTATNSS